MGNWLETVGHDLESAAGDGSLAVAAITLGIVLAICITVVALVRSVDQKNRIQAIKELAPVLIALAERATAIRRRHGKLIEEHKPPHPETQQSTPPGRPTAPK